MLYDTDNLVLGKGEAVSKASNACALDMSAVTTALAKQPSLKSLNLPEIERAISSLGLPTEESINFDFAPYAALSPESLFSICFYLSNVVAVDAKFAEHGSSIVISDDGKTATNTKGSLNTAFVDGPFLKKGKKVWSFSADSSQCMAVVINSF